MVGTTMMMLCLAQASSQDLRVQLIQVYPPRSEFRRSQNQNCAVLLLHGLDRRNDGSSPAIPRFQAWQGSTSTLVKRLGREADVFSICHAQTTPVEEVANSVGNRDALRLLKSELGYQRIVLIGHSAGGLVARHFVEDFPQAGVDLVIQVACPNAGAWRANLFPLAGVPKEQHQYIRSLTPKYRERLLNRRKKLIPSKVDFVVVITDSTPKAKSDTVVSVKRQWPRDLHHQMIPCVVTQARHNDVMIHSRCIETIAKLVGQRNPRWKQSKIFAKRKGMGLIN